MLVAEVADGEPSVGATRQRSAAITGGTRTAVHSLEDKLRQAREALAHFRQQHLTQRQQELQRHDTQTQQLQHELRERRELRADLQRKLEELSTLSRDNERLMSELRAERQQGHRLDQEQAHLRHLHQESDAAQHYTRPRNAFRR
ncbi:hypothetical protein D3C72_1710090 [compost metagenome]